ncbi:MAG: hypothetical protein EBY18_08255 [Alphaproteobacteria bacterium]|nr:hypothetical protein [Alphaproteobacteria bacterium]
MRALLLALALAAGLIGCHGRAVLAQAPTLTVADRTTSRTYSRPELLADPRLQTVSIAYDPVYRRPMTYRAIAIAALLKGAKIGDDDHVQARAVDDFSVSIPAGLLTSTPPSGPEAFLAVEDPAMPWPAIPGTTKGSAGPFYIVWRGGTRAEISSEYWAYHLAALAVTDSGKPASNATILKFLRNPKSVRTWPEEKMPAFDEESLSDADIDAIIAWLAYKAGHRR